MKTYARKSGLFSCVMPIIAVLALAVPAAAHELGGTDVAVVIDVSRSMRLQRNFKAARDRLIKFVEEAVDPGMNFVLVAFGEQTRVVIQQQVATDEDKAAIIKALQDLEPSDRKTSIAAGVDAAVKALDALPSDPNRKKLLILITDGADKPSKEGSEITFSALKEAYGSKFGKDKNEIFWHCFLGKPASEVSDFVEAVSSSEKQIDGEWDYTKVGFAPHYLKLRPMPVGDWEADLKDLLQGEDLKLRTPLPGQYEIEFSDVLLENAQPGEKIEISPRRITLAEAEQGVEIKLKAVNLFPGEKSGIITVRCPDKMMFVIAHFHISLTVLPANIAVRPSSLQFGPLVRGKSLEKTIETTPDEVAVKVAAGKAAKIIFPTDLPAGVTLRAEPEQVPLDKPASAKLILSAAPDAAITPEGYSGSILFAKVGSVTFKPETVPFSFKTVGGRIDVAPGDGIDFGPVAAGTTVTRELKLIPDEGARASNPQVEIAPDGALPKGVTASAEPTPVTVSQETSVKVMLSVARDAGLSAPISGAFALKVPDGSASLSTDRVQWKAAPGVGMIAVSPATLDFGNVPPGNSSTLQLALAPDEAAAAIAPTVEAALVSELPKGITLDIQPAKVAIKDKTILTLTLTVAGDAATAGQIKGIIALKAQEKAVAFSAQQIEWKGVASAAVIALKPVGEINLGEIEIGQSVSRTITLTPNETAAAAKPRIILTAADVSQGDTVTIVPVQAILETMAEFNLAVKAGDQPGVKSFRINASTDSRIARLESQPIKVSYTVTPGKVTFPDVAQLKFEAASGEAPHELSTAMLATPGAIGDVVKLEAVFNNLPKGMTVEASPQQVSVKEAKADMKITLVVEGAVPGDYEGVVRFIAKSDVNPKEIPVKLSIVRRVLDITGTPGLWTIKVSALSPRIKGVELPVNVKANPYAAGLKLTLKPDRPLPPGVSITMEPAELSVKEGDNTAVLKADVELKWSLFGISHRGILDLTPDRKSVEVNGGKVGWVVESGGLWIYLIPIAAIILILIWYSKRRSAEAKKEPAAK